VVVSQSTICGNAVDERTKVDLSRIQVGLLNGRLYRDILESYNQTVRGIALKNNLLFIDLENKLEKKYEYYFDYIHYTNKGSERVAEIIYSGLYPLLKKDFGKYK
jgi:lysophospholipase L1-like esterase